MKKTKHYLTNDEWRYCVHILNTMKTKLHSEGKHTDMVDDTLLAFLKAKTKRVKVAK